eukprot:TRINITY_DN3759_c0_g1_i1.p1 TRINITY_DN3759_c0_g1~~TRINITY_DN3759_c0_g1_i1.p1  ORF type:complete len:1308 (-),score=330.34 TRINITY_DN3759_c0_g1_i1:15-3938(-)
MGVPRFFRWISERYPLINHNIDFENSGPVIDNLYLDMNGIIHNCSHANSEDLEALAMLTEDDIVIRIFQYIDRLFNIAKPQKLLYMAIDGVAPRAKMNQQRQRRFKSAKEAREKIEQLIDEGMDVPPKSPFDSNCITPGTEFMERISKHLRFFVQKKINEDSAWRDIRIIFSGSEVPGEGEHKIMEYIRNSKSQDDWEPNQVHCIYGLDADLIMLSLVTHEPYFCLLREEGVLNRRYDKKKVGEAQEFHLLHISLLREYLEIEYSGIASELQFEFDIERIIDDWIVLCFLVGNDFLPSLPGLDIAEGSLNELMEMYKSILPELDGYITENGEIVEHRINRIFQELSFQESQFFAILPEEIDSVSKEIISNNKEDAELADVLYGSSGNFDDFNMSGLGESSEIDAYWKFNYYNQKFGLDYVNDYEEIKKIAMSFIEALCWVEHYYYHGCVSWSWFYPYHYPPLVSDLVDLEWDIKFELSEPFSPLQQLISVLPPSSGKLFLPKPYSDLMSDPEMKPHYPNDFDTDLNGKKYEWEAIALISFLDADLIFRKTKEVNSMLTEEEKLRNTFGDAVIFNYAPYESRTVQSTIPLYFDDIEEARCTEEIFLLPELVNPEPFTTVEVDYSFLPAGCPSLHSIEFKTKIYPVKVDVFGNKSRKDSMLIIIPDNEDEKKLDKALNNLLGRDCFLWPYNREAKVVGISTAENFYKKNGSPLKLKDERDWVRDIESINKFWRGTKATDVGYVDVIVSVRKLIGMVREKNGSVFRRYDSNIEKYPLSMVFSESITEFDYRFDHTFRNWYSEFAPNSECISTRKGPFFGALCKVTGYQEKPEFAVKVNAQLLPTDPFNEIADVVAKHSDGIYYNQSSVCKMLGISSRTLSKITGIVMFKPGNFNVGLKLKFSGRNTQTLGYTRRMKNERGNYTSWEYSQKTIDLLSEYMDKFPEIFHLLDTEPNADAYDSTVPFEYEDEPVSSSDDDIILEESSSDADIFIDGDLSVSIDEEEVIQIEKQKYNPRLLEVVDYVKGLGLKELDQVDCGSSELSDVALLELQEVIDDWRNKIKIQNRSDFIYPESLIRPIGNFEVSNSNLVKTYNYGIPVFEDEINIGDRVVNLRDSGPMVFGARGTVIGIKGQYIELLLDEPAVGGVTLYGRVQNLRGQVVSKGSVLNITQPYRKQNKKPVQKRKDKKSQSFSSPSIKSKKKVTTSSVEGTFTFETSPVPAFVADEFQLTWQQQLLLGDSPNQSKKKNQNSSESGNTTSNSNKKQQNKKVRRRGKRNPQRNPKSEPNTTQQQEESLFYNPNKKTKWVRKQQ